MDLTGMNLNKKIIHVKHTELTRVGESPFRSDCPVCKEGILFVRRNNNTGQITNEDRCILCGQAFIYEDLP